MAFRSPLILRSALAINFVLSAGCGLTSIVYASWLAITIGALPAWLFTAVGIGLLVFASGIGWTLRRLRIGQALLISALDLLWVIGTLPLVLVPGLLTSAGGAVVLALAVVVGTLGVLQLLGVRRMLLSGTTQAGPYRHCIRIRSAADPAKLWAVIRDLGNISRYSPGLSASRLEGGAVAPGAVRVCTNTRAESWAEEVTELDDTARRVDFRFRSEADDFPFPLAGLVGGWLVTAAEGGGSDVDVWWEVTPKQRWFGWLVVALMTIPLDRDVPRIVGAMEAEAMGLGLPLQEGVTRQRRALRVGYC